MRAAELWKLVRQTAVEYTTYSLTLFLLLPKSPVLSALYWLEQQCCAVFGPDFGRICFPSLLFSVGFTISSCIYHLLDHYNCFPSKKVHKRDFRSNAVSWRDMWPTVVLNHVLWHCLTLYVVFYHLFDGQAVWKGVSLQYDLGRDMWHVVHCLFITLGALTVFDTGFYWMHRLMHHPLLYKRVHALHHRTFASTALSGAYMTAPDYILVSQYLDNPERGVCHQHVQTQSLPAAAISLVLHATYMNMPMLCHVWIATLASINAAHTHSGFVFPILPTPLSHEGRGCARYMIDRSMNA
ncbi:MAG: hypothetical protein MHM6MM_000494 [Cercozoa sp. M6MM]